MNNYIDENVRRWRYEHGLPYPSVRKEYTLNDWVRIWLERNAK